MNSKNYLTFYIIFSFVILSVYSWTDEDLELFDLVESTDRKFYDILGVDQKASASDIRKAYRKLSQKYHPDRNDAPDAEETFRKIAAIADVLRNEEQRRKYDVILQTGLPDWREPVYYYRRVRNMGLFDLVIFLFCLATVGQYLFAWSAYWEKKYELEELMSSRFKKRAKLQKKGKAAKNNEEFDIENEIDLPKPKCQDLFPVKLVYFSFHVVISSPYYLKASIVFLSSLFQKQDTVTEEDDEEIEPEVRIKPKKSVASNVPQYPELSDINQNSHVKSNGATNVYQNENVMESHHEADMNELKKAMKKIPHGTLQRWEKIASYLHCSVNEVIVMAKQMKSLELTKNKLSLLEMQGISGLEKTEINGSCTINEDYETAETVKIRVKHANGTNHNGFENCNGHNIEKIWKQEEQRSLELALQKYPKDTSARWDRIAEFVQTKTKEECITRYKELAQQIKKKKVKDN